MTLYLPEGRLSSTHAYVGINIHTHTIWNSSIKKIFLSSSIYLFIKIFASISIHERRFILLLDYDPKLLKNFCYLADCLFLLFK